MESRSTIPPIHTANLILKVDTDFLTILSLSQSNTTPIVHYNHFCKSPPTHEQIYTLMSTMMPI